MGKYIDRDALVKKITEKFQAHYGDTCYQFIHDFFRCVIRLINKAPAADVEEKVYGKWERRGFDGHNCSYCGALNDIDTNFCPNCGAQMVEGVERGKVKREKKMKEGSD